MKRADAEHLLNTLRLSDTELSNTPEPWSEANTVGLSALLHFEGAELWFYRRVQRMRVAIPDALRAELRLASQSASIMNMRIDAQTIAVTTLLNGAAISWSLLKGQARRAATSLYPNADARRVSDVDLLVPEADAQRAWQLLLNNGFRRVIKDSEDWSTHHLPVLIDDNNVAVELHTTTSMSVPPAEAWRRATVGADAVEWSGIQTTVPCATELVWQALAAGAGDGVDGFYLKTLLSVAAILEMNPEIQWAEIERRLNAREAIDNETSVPLPRERVLRFFAVAADLAGITLPASLMPRHRARFASLLLWRANVLAASHRRDVRDRLLEEGVRVEASLAITPSVRNVSVLRNLRRRAASVGARGAYFGWRAWGARR